MRTLILLLLAVSCSAEIIPSFKIEATFSNRTTRDSVVSKVNSYSPEYSDKIQSYVITPSSGASYGIVAVIWANIGARDDLLAVTTTYLSSNSSKVKTAVVSVHNCGNIEMQPCKEYLIYTK